VVDEGSFNSAVNVIGFFLEFAEKLLAPARSFVDVEGMPKRVEHPFLFRGPEFSRPAASGSTISFSGLRSPISGVFCSSIGSGGPRRKRSAVP